MMGNHMGVYWLLLYDMKLLFIPLIFNTNRSIFFDTALRVLRNAMLSKHESFYLYHSFLILNVQDILIPHSMSCLASRYQNVTCCQNTHAPKIGFDNVYWGYFLIFATKSAVFLQF